MRMSPTYGHQYAADHGFPYSDNDIAQRESKDAIELWMRLSSSFAGTIISDAAWWMLPLMDPKNKLNSMEGMALYNKLIPFATTTLGLLSDAGIITLNLDDVEIPDIQFSNEGGLTEEQKDMLDALSKDADPEAFLQELMEKEDADSEPDGDVMVAEKDSEEEDEGAE